MGLGELHLLRRDYEAAVKAFTRVMGDDSRRPEALARRGYAVLKLEDYERAIRDLTQAIELRPSLYLPRVHLGVAYEWQAKLDEARNAYTTARDMEPDRPEAICRMGYLLWIEADLEGAKKALELAIKKDRRYLLAYLYLAQVQVQAGDLNGGRRTYAKALKLDENCVQAYLELARLCIELGKLPDALKSIKKALELEPERVESIHVMGQVYYKMKKYDEARETLLLALDLDPKFAAAYRTMGRIDEDKEQFDEATVQYERAVELDPVDPFARFLLGMLLYEMGNDEAALEHLVAYLDMVGEDKSVEAIVQQLEGK
jgi:tetratricopeptide (TPR) repeat protein